MAEDDVIARLERIEAKLAKLQRRVEQQIAEGQALRADVRLLTGVMTGVATSVQALVDHQMQLATRVSALEAPPET